MISVIVPVLNAEKTISRCIDSLISQTVSIDEIIIIDDGSTDSSGRICDLYAEKNKNIQVYHTDNKGVSSARNLGIREAAGEYIGFVDSDDWIESDMYESLLLAMKTTDAELSACGVIHETSHGSFSDRNDGELEIVDGAACYKAILYSQGIRGYLCNKLFKRELIMNLIDESIAQCEDLLFVTQYMEKVHRVVYINKALYHYTRQSTPVFFDYTPRELTLMDAYEKVLCLYQEKAPEYAPIVEMNTLKIYLNYRARAKIKKERSKETNDKIHCGVKRHFFSVMLSNVPVRQKINAILTYTSPQTMLRIKRRILQRHHLSGKWES